MATVLPFLVIIIAFWFLLIRPQQKKQRQVREMQSALAAGDEVMLTSGIFGTVEAIADDHVLVNVADGVTLKVVRAAIGQVTPKESPLEDAAESEAVADDPTEDESVAGAPAAGEADGQSAAETPEETLERLNKQGENR